jgi:phage gp16-like protein
MANKPTRDRRGIELAKIHMGANKLGLDTKDKDPDSPYRSMLWAVGRVRSAAQLDASGRAAVLDYMRRLGFESPKYRPKPSKATVAQINKVRAQLHDAGRDEAYGDALAKRICKVEKLVWCKPDQLNRIVAALWYDQKRRQTRTES